MEPTRLSNPPIVEAMIELRVERQGDIESTVLETFRTGLEVRFPTRQESMEVQWQLPMSPASPTATATKQVRGLVFFSENRDRAAQVSPERFAFSRVRSYTSWEELRDESRELWLRYVEITAPSRVVGIAVRFINRLELSLVSDGAEAFLNALPIVPEGLPPMVRSVMQAVMQDPATHAEVVLTQSIAPSVRESLHTVDVDIHVRQGFSVSPDAPELWERMDVLRELKNRVFFASFTDRALEPHR